MTQHDPTPAEHPQTVEGRQLRDEFLRLLTQDGETRNPRRREYNAAIFDAEEGWAVFIGTNLDMVMEKFDRAIRNVAR